MSTLNGPGFSPDALFDQLPLSEVMSKEVLTVYEGWSVKRLAGFFVKHGISAAPVIASDEELVGVVTLADVVQFDSRERTDSEMENLVWMYTGLSKGSLSDTDLKHLKDRASETCTVYSIMAPHVPATDVSTAMSAVCETLTGNDAHHLFITQDGKLVGVVTAKDILKHMLHH